MQNAKCENAKCKMQNVKFFYVPLSSITSPLSSFKNHVPHLVFSFFFCNFAMLI